MDNMKIKHTKYTPEIDFSADENRMNIIGKCTPENTFEFFEPVKNWLNEYFQNPRECIVTFNVPYFNSSSSRTIYDLFDIFSGADDSKITINWEYNENNENGQESGEEFKEDFDALNINLVIVNN